MGEDIRRMTGTILRAPLTLRTVRELLYCGFGGLAGAIGFLITVVMLALGLTISASVLGTVIGLIGVGLGALIRHTAGAISALAGVLFVLPLILIPLGTSIQNSVGQFMPMLIAENSMTAVKPVAHSLSPGVGFAMLCLYAAAALAAGGWALARRDA